MVLWRILRRGIGFNHSFIVLCNEINNTSFDKPSSSSQSSSPSKYMNDFWKSVLSKLPERLADKLPQSQTSDVVTTHQLKDRFKTLQRYGVSPDSPSSVPEITENALTQSNDSVSPQQKKDQSTLSSILEDELNNSLPVQYEHYAKEWLQITMQDLFDGFRLEAMKSVTPKLQASHSLFLGTTSRPTGYLYQFGPTFCLEDGSMFLMARYGTDGVLTVRGLKKLNDSIEFRLSGNSSLDSPQGNMAEMALDYSGKGWCTCLKSAWQGTWILNGSFSQLVTQQLSLGGDLTWIAATNVSVGSIGFRYDTRRHIFSGTFMRQPNCKSLSGGFSNCHSAKFQYCHKVSNRLGLGTELEVGFEGGAYESALRFGYEYIFQQARVQGLLDTSGKVSLVAQDASGFGVSGLIDYWRGDYRFGFLLQLIPPPQETSAN